jgi:hypothetical protein
MDATENRRAEPRLRYHWPIWYTDHPENDVSQGQMLDVSSRAAAFTCYVRDFCPVPDQQITARFSVPQYGSEDSFGMADFTRTGRVARIDGINDLVRRVVVQFHEPLHFKPGEQAQMHETVCEQMASVPF